jgi:hypothetical protein
MARDAIEPEIDRLYQLPAEDFTRERNNLAKELKGDAAKRVRALPKPSASAWAVNQLYWRDRKTYDALVSTSERLRAAHRAVLGGRNADLRQTDAAHREAHKAALASITRLLDEAGHRISSAAQNEIARTLERLPVDGPPGRLAKPLRPEGFEALQGTPVRAAPSHDREAEPKTPRATTSPREAAAAARAEKAARKRERQEAARVLKAVRERERREREQVAKLRRQLAAAERDTVASRQQLERARDAEATLTRALEDAEASWRRSERALRQAESDQP